MEKRGSIRAASEGSALLPRGHVPVPPPRLMSTGFPPCVALRPVRRPTGLMVRLHKILARARAGPPPCLRRHQLVAAHGPSCGDLELGAVRREAQRELLRAIRSPSNRAWTCDCPAEDGHRPDSLLARDCAWGGFLNGARSPKHFAHPWLESSRGTSLC